MTGEKVMALLALLAEQSGENVSQVRLEFMARKLLPYAPEMVCEALEYLSENSRRFPTIAEIKKEMGVGEPVTHDQALLLVDHVLGLIPRYGEILGGRTNTARALNLQLGLQGQILVERQGGWNSLVERAGENISVLRAQLRDVAESYFNCGILEAPDFETLPNRAEAYALANNPKFLEEEPQGIGDMFFNNRENSSGMLVLGNKPKRGKDETL